MLRQNTVYCTVYGNVHLFQEIDQKTSDVMFMRRCVVLGHALSRNKNKDHEAAYKGIITSDHLSDHVSARGGYTEEAGTESSSQRSFRATWDGTRQIRNMQMLMTITIDLVGISSSFAKTFLALRLEGKSPLLLTRDMGSSCAKTCLALQLVGKEPTAPCTCISDEEKYRRCRSQVQTQNKELE